MIFKLRTRETFHIDNVKEYKTKLLHWSQTHQHIIWLDSNDYPSEYCQYEAILAVGCNKILKSSFSGAFDALKNFVNEVKDWTFGYLTYDLKNDIENLKSNNLDGVGFPELFFFQPTKIILIKGNQLEFIYLEEFKAEISTDYHEILKSEIGPFSLVKSNSPNIKMRIFKDEYFRQVEKILNHINRGDIYEVNFSQEFYMENTEINPYLIYQRLNTISNPPFATFLRLGHHYLLSASPERYLKKSGLYVISQPIKGTAARATSLEDDNSLKEKLAADPKEKSENIMVVDMVRNDLSKIAEKGSVEVEELCKVYTFDQVHQMISTIKCQIRPEVHPVDIIKETFPMGSMTGTPKVSALRIIEELEAHKRGLYSGAVGYFTPNGDFDFNVIIRSILYNANRKYVTFMVGSAITAKSIPELEYQECLVKAKAMREVLENIETGDNDFK